LLTNVLYVAVTLALACAAVDAGPRNAFAERMPPMSFFTRSRADAPLKGDLIPAEPPRGVVFRNPLLADGARIIDAEFVDVGKAGPADVRRAAINRPNPLRSERSFFVAPDDRGLTRRLSTRLSAGLSGGWAFGALVAVLSALSFWLAGGHALAGKPASDAGRLAIEQVESRIVEASGRRILVVDGTLANHGRRITALPQIAVAADGAVHAIEPAASFLDPGKRQAFHGRFLAPEGADWTVAVSFFQP
jgi:hypothetical protein